MHSWEDGAYSGSATREATLRDTADGRASGTCHSLDVATAGINKGGTKYTLVSGNDVGNTARTGKERVFVSMADTAGTESDPYLAITTQAPGFAAMF